MTLTIFWSRFAQSRRMRVDARQGLRLRRDGGTLLWRNWAPDAPGPDATGALRVIAQRPRADAGSHHFRLGIYRAATRPDRSEDTSVMSMEEIG